MPLIGETFHGSQRSLPARVPFFVGTTAGVVPAAGAHICAPYVIRGDALFFMGSAPGISLAGEGGGFAFAGDASVRPDSFMGKGGGFTNCAGDPLFVDLREYAQNQDEFTTFSDKNARKWRCE